MNFKWRIVDEDDDDGMRLPISWIFIPLNIDDRILLCDVIMMYCKENNVPIYGDEMNSMTSSL